MPTSIKGVKACQVKQNWTGLDANGWVAVKYVVNAQRNVRVNRVIFSQINYLENGYVMAHYSLS